MLYVDAVFNILNWLLALIRERSMVPSISTADSFGAVIDSSSNLVIPANEYWLTEAVKLRLNLVVFLGSALFAISVTPMPLRLSGNTHSIPSPKLLIILLPAILPSE